MQLGWPQPHLPGPRVRILILVIVVLRTSSPPYLDYQPATRLPTPDPSCSSTANHKHHHYPLPLPLPSSTLSLSASTRSNLSGDLVPSCFSIAPSRASCPFPFARALGPTQPVATRGPVQVLLSLPPVCASRPDHHFSFSFSIRARRLLFLSPSLATRLGYCQTIQLCCALSFKRRVLSFGIPIPYCVHNLQWSLPRDSLTCSAAHWIRAESETVREPPGQASSRSCRMRCTGYRAALSLF